MCSKPLRIGDVEIPGLVAFHILLCCRAGWREQNSSVFTDGLVPKLPKGHTKDSLRRMSKAQMLPAVCGGCQRLMGSIEGGRLSHQCHYCMDETNFNSSDSWSIIGALSHTLGDWATDAVVCAVLGAFLENKQEREYDNFHTEVQ